MNKNGINQNGVTYLRINEQTNEYYFVYYLGDGVELSLNKTVTSQKEIENINFTDLLPSPKE
jgi:hypothetical protein